MMINITKEVAKQYTELEHMLAVHGGDTNLLLKQARSLAGITSMSIKEAVQEVISRDAQTKMDSLNF